MKKWVPYVYAVAMLIIRLIDVWREQNQRRHWNDQDSLY